MTRREPRRLTRKEQAQAPSRDHILIRVGRYLIGLPLVFELCSQTPLVMLFLSTIVIFTAADYRARRGPAILIIAIVAMVLTPGPDVSSMLLLSVPMILLYELGFFLVGRSRSGAVA